MDEDMDHGRQWADWLNERLNGRPQKWLVDHSDGKIGKHTVSLWLKGNRPSIESAVLTADVFQVKRSDALKAAGYDSLVDDLPQPPIAEKDPLDDPRFQRISELIREVEYELEQIRSGRDNEESRKRHGV